MPRLQNSKILPYSASAMYQVVADVEAYPEVLRYIQSLEILRQKDNVLMAQVKVGIGRLAFSYECAITLLPEKQIDIVATSGPFQHLTAQWVFTPLTENSCRVDYRLDSRFRSPLMEKTAGLIFAQQLTYSIAAFEARLRKP
jgi:coenzyme Q-binding protein COQ10